MQHIGRRQILRDQHQPLACRQLRRQRNARRPSFSQRIQHALDDLAHIGRAPPQILVLDRLELLHHFLELDRQCPLGVDQTVADQVARSFGEQRILENQQVQVEEGTHFVRRIGRDAGLQQRQFVPDFVESLGQAPDFVHDVAALDPVLADLELRRGEQVGAADRDPARNAAARQRFPLPLGHPLPRSIRPRRNAM